MSNTWCSVYSGIYTSVWSTFHEKPTMPKASPKKKNSIVFPKTSVPKRPGKKIQDVVVVPKKPRIVVTPNQRAVARVVAEQVRTGKKVSVSKAMRESGVYSAHTSKIPGKLTKSKGWEALMKEYLPDDLLAEKHNELLTVSKKTRRTLNGEVVEEIEELDVNALRSGLDMAYKIKGRYKETPPPTDTGSNKTLESINTLVKMLNEERAKNK